MSSTKSLLLMLLFVAAPLFAADDVYLSVPGLCDADDAVLEESDAIFLTAHGIENHYFDCRFERPIEEALRNGSSMETEASCQSAIDSWRARFEIIPGDDGILKLFQESGGLTPVRFYPCKG